MDDARALCRRIGHEFAEPGLLDDALTHRSADRRHNERLEFLGDAVLGLTMAELLYRRRPDADEGDLTRYRALLVRGDTLAEVASEIELGKHLNLGGGEQKSGGHRRSSILADALEALIAAVYLDAGLEAARALVERLFRARLDDLPHPDSLKDPKTRLQELLQGRGQARPDYDLVSEEGDAHRRVFHAVCRVPALSLEAEGRGSSRRKAEQAAAAAVLEQVIDD